VVHRNARQWWTEAAMFGFHDDKIEWIIGVLLVTAMAVVAFA
jgi:hypothetical protein